MNQDLWEVREYEDESGSSPFNNWLSTLDNKTQQRILARLVRLRSGNFGDHKSIGDNVYELRFFFGAGYRIYYAIEKKRIVLLLSGGDKKNQSKDIRKAKQRWELYKASSAGS